jgi:hypothetical protein
MMALASFPSAAPAASKTVTQCDQAHLEGALAGGGTVTFACDGTITLSNTITIAADTVLDATGRAVTISGNGAVRVFQVNTGVMLTLLHLTLADGLAQGATNVSAGATGGTGAGGAIYNNGGVARAVDCAFLRNRARGGDGGPGGNFMPIAPGAGGAARGGAIYNANGQVVANNCVFMANLALGGAAGVGMALAPFGPGGDSAGGAMYSDRGAVELVNCDLSHNASVSGVGRRFGVPVLSGSGFGGAIGNGGGELRMVGCHVSSNASGGQFSAPAIGGAIYQIGGTLTLADCSLSDNRAQGGPGLSTIGGGTAAPGGAASGGALHLQSGAAFLTNSTVANNLAQGGDGDTTGFQGGSKSGGAFGGALFNAGSVSLLNCTLAGNEAVGGSGLAPGATRGDGMGGAIYNAAGFGVLTHVTIANNAARAGSTGIANSGAAQGGGLFSTNGSLTLRNTLLAYSPSGSNCFGSAFTDEGNNISSDASCPFTASGSKSNSDPVLAPLDDYGGPTPTMPLLAGSPAIDGASSAFCPPTDQRGIARPFGPACDIGAFESAPPYTIRGRVHGFGIAGGISVAAGKHSAITDGDGNYRLDGLNVGSYLVIPAAAGIVFVPASTPVTVGPDALGINFKAYWLNALVVEELTNNMMHFVFAGTNGQAYRVQSCTNVVHWETFSTNTVGTNGIFEFFDSPGPSHPTRFFRTIRP